MSDDVPTSSLPSGDGSRQLAERGIRGFLRRLFEVFRRAVPAASAPVRIGRYRVLGLLGEGGMGRVFLAEDDSLRRKVALKMLKKREHEARQRFLREARAAARISHPNLCPIFEVGEEDDWPFLAMELLSGETLSARLRAGPLAPAEALDLAEDLLAALSALHEVGLVHRDVKPSNFFVTRHGGKLVDFGLARETPSDVARAVQTSSAHTAPGQIVGTPGYMPPEQILGKAVDPRADLFAAGALVYESLSGRRPFPGDGAAAAISATLYDEPATLGSTPELAALDAVLRRALAKRPSERHASARQMAEALRAAMNAAPTAPNRSREAFVGRRDELLWLEERFAEAVAGSGSVAFVTGDKGVGKSTLIAELMRRLRAGAAPVTVVTGKCAETHGPAEAFLPFLDAMGRLLSSRGRDNASELLRTHAPTVCVQMPAGLLPDPDGALRRQTVGATKERLIREAGYVLESASRAFPILLFLEDLQWADPASVDLLHHLACRLDRQRTLIVAAFRHADLEANNPYLKRCAVDLQVRGAARELSLAAFAEEDVRTYLEIRFPKHRFAAALAGVLYARTEGLPLFLRSLVDILVQRGDILRAAEGWALAGPVEQLDLAPTKGLQELLRDHLEGLERPQREILEAASVAGREFLSPVIAHVVGRDEPSVEEELRRLCRVRRLIVEIGEETLPDGSPATRYRFVHTLYAELLREDLVASRRHQLHRAIAARLRHHWGEQAPRLATEIARHCEEGRDYVGAVAFRGHAGDNAARRYAYREAEEHYDRAFRFVEMLPAETRPVAAIELHRKRGSARLAQARFDVANADYASMLALARASAAPEAERDALAGICDALFFAQRAQELAARAQELLEAANRAASEAATAEAHARIGQVLVGEGRLDEAVPMLEQAIAASRRAGAPVALQIALSYRAFVHYWQAEFAAAEALDVEAFSLSREQGNGFYALAAWMFTGLARANLGRLSEALDDFTDATAAARRNDDRYWLPRLVSHLGWVHRELGALDRARQHDLEAVALARERPVWGPETEVQLSLCVDDVREGRAEQATAALAELQQRCAASTWLRWLSELRVAAAVAEHWAARGDHAAVAEHAARLAEVARRVGARNYLCAAGRLRTAAALQLGDGIAGAAADLDAALGGLRRTPAPLEAWKSERILALAKRRLGDESGALAAFAEAARAVRTIAAGTRDQALRDGFLAIPAVREVLEAAPAEGSGSLAPGASR